MKMIEWVENYTHKFTDEREKKTLPTLFTLIAWWRSMLCIFKQFDNYCHQRNLWENPNLQKIIIGCLSFLEHEL